MPAPPPPNEYASLVCKALNACACITVSFNSVYCSCNSWRCGEVCPVCGASYPGWTVSLLSETRIPSRRSSVLCTSPETSWCSAHHPEGPRGRASRRQRAVAGPRRALKSCATDWAAASPRRRSPRSPAPSPAAAEVPSCCAQAGAGLPPANRESTTHFSRTWKFSRAPRRLLCSPTAGLGRPPVSSWTRRSSAGARRLCPRIPAGTGRLCWGCCRGCSPAPGPPRFCSRSTTWPVSKRAHWSRVLEANIIFIDPIKSIPKHTSG